MMTKAHRLQNVQKIMLYRITTETWTQDNHTIRVSQTNNRWVFKSLQYNWLAGKTMDSRIVNINTWRLTSLFKQTGIWDKNKYLYKLKHMKHDVLTKHNNESCKSHNLWNCHYVCVKEWNSYFLYGHNTVLHWYHWTIPSHNRQCTNSYHGSEFGSIE